MQESLLLAHLHPKPESNAAADEGGNDSSSDDSRGSGDIASDDEDDQLTRLLQVGKLRTKIEFSRQAISFNAYIPLIIHSNNAKTNN